MARQTVPYPLFSPFKKLAEVYKKIWLASHEPNVPMRVIYRMRGLLGEATEEFIEKLGNEEEDEEQIYSRAQFVASDGGLELILERISSVKCLTSKSRPLLDRVTTIKLKMEWAEILHRGFG